ncbi:RRXRR domain-containing protein [Candidatus Hydrogenisulfobacillus filiaventi]|uniref:RRXRR domain-containing protein n=1 Tax=Candidatus Hydrogenisulfobacillus filiaventi TaxID=2707344 RepID=A0A6F8ZIR9_9FIRM|nr:RRXRR domain-containing protein [Candidatus Hydrogenisulfobacillus filiaventi]
MRRFRKGFFYLQLLDRTDGAAQPVACGIDPGSKWEGIAVKDARRTFVNLHVDAVTHVREAVTARRDMRRGRRYRKTPCRPPRANRARGGLPPSTRARWGWKLRIAGFLASLYPITHFVVEDVAAQTRPGQHRWNVRFSPLEAGKRWFSMELGRLAPVTMVPGYDTKRLRDARGLPKTANKSRETFWAHCVDAWVLAASVVGGAVPDHTPILRMAPLRFRRRSLHLRQPAKGGGRRRHGGTVSLGLRRGTQVLHPKFGFCYVGGYMGNRLSLHAMRDGRRLTQNARREDIVALAPCSWRVWRPKERRKGGAPPRG